MVLPQAMAWVQYWFRVLSLKFCGKSKKICGDISQLSPAFCMYAFILTSGGFRPWWSREGLWTAATLLYSSKSDGDKPFMKIGDFSQSNTPGQNSTEKKTKQVKTLYFLSMRKLGQGRLWRSVPTSRPSIKVNLKISSKMGIDRSFKMDSSYKVGLRYRNAGNAMFSRSRLRDALRLYTQAFFISSVRSSNSHPDLLVIQHPTHFFRSHRSSTLDFHFLSHYSYIKAIKLYKGNYWTHLLATCIPYGYNRTSLQDSAR